MDDISKTFRDHDRHDPRKDKFGEPSRLLQKQLSGYSNEDPGETQEKAIPLTVIRELHRVASTDIEKTLADLDTGALFFCMRSCEYTRVPEANKMRTKLLTLKNFRFFKNNKEINHYSKQLADSDFVSITFEMQKNNEKNDTVTQERNKDPLLCPVKAWARIIINIRKDCKASDSTPINVIRQDNKLYKISSKDNINFLRKTVSTMKDRNLGFDASEIGTHSIRSGGAMTMKLLKEEDSTIMLIGRWKSIAFLKYIRKQIKEFSTNLSSRMLEFEYFSHLPKFNKNASPHKLRMVPPTVKN